jgi:phosphoribosylformimino-5-aminoimidazole carboxamide ribotide isomerase
MVKGWQESTKHKLIESLKAFKAQGYEWFLVTNIEHDGCLEGPDYATYATISDLAKIIASGGVSSLQDILILKQIDIEALVIGKAFYMNIFTLAEANEVARC